MISWWSMYWTFTKTRRYHQDTFYIRSQHSTW